MLNTEEEEEEEEANYQCFMALWLMCFIMSCLDVFICAFKDKEATERPEIVGCFHCRTETDLFVNESKKERKKEGQTERESKQE